VGRRLGGQAWAGKGLGGQGLGGANNERFNTHALLSAAALRATTALSSLLADDDACRLVRSDRISSHRLPASLFAFLPG